MVVAPTSLLTEATNPDVRCCSHAVRLSAHFPFLWFPIPAAGFAPTSSAQRHHNHHHYTNHRRQSDATNGGTDAGGGLRRGSRVKRPNSLLADMEMHHDLDPDFDPSAAGPDAAGACRQHHHAHLPQGPDRRLPHTSYVFGTAAHALGRGRSSAEPPSPKRSRLHGDEGAGGSRRGAAARRRRRGGRGGGAGAGYDSGATSEEYDDLLAEVEEEEELELGEAEEVVWGQRQRPASMRGISQVRVGAGHPAGRQALPRPVQRFPAQVCVSLPELPPSTCMRESVAQSPIMRRRSELSNGPLSSGGGGSALLPPSLLGTNGGPKPNSIISPFGPGASLGTHHTYGGATGSAFLSGGGGGGPRPTTSEARTGAGGRKRRLSSGTAARRTSVDGDYFAGGGVAAVAGGRGGGGGPQRSCGLAAAEAEGLGVGLGADGDSSELEAMQALVGLATAH